MVCLELWQIRVRVYSFFCFLCQGWERGERGREREEAEDNCKIAFTISWF